MKSTDTGLDTDATERIMAERRGETGSEFLDWFIAQHGRAPIGNHTERELRDRVSDGLYAAETLRRQEIWNARKESALYAWNARKKC